jgi:hypothetical protein
MEFDPRLTPRLRDRALTRLNDLTTGAAAFGLVATAGLGTVAALTTHKPGVSAPSDTTPAGTTDDTTNPPATTNGSRSGTLRLPSTGSSVLPPTSGSGRRHATTGGS